MRLNRKFGSSMELNDEAPGLEDGGNAKSDDEVGKGCRDESLGMCIGRRGDSCGLRVSWAGVDIDRSRGGGGRTSKQVRALPNPNTGAFPS